MSRDAHLAVTVCIKFEVDTTIRCLVIAFIAADALRDFVINTSTKFEDLTAIRS